MKITLVSKKLKEKFEEMGDSGEIDRLIRSSKDPSSNKLLMCGKKEISGWLEYEEEDPKMKQCLMKLMNNDLLGFSRDFINAKYQDEAKIYGEFSIDRSWFIETHVAKEVFR